MNIRFKLLLSLFVACVLGIILILAGERSPAPVYSQRLPDGSTLRLICVSYGKQHDVKIAPSFWESWLRNWRPAPKIQMAITASIPTLQDALVFYLTRRGRDGSYFKIRPETHYAVRDKHGCHFEGPRLGWFISNYLVVFGQLSELPRREKMLHLCLYDDRGNSLAQFILPNPAKRRHPEWTPEQLPLAKRDGDLEFTLLKLQGYSQRKNHTSSSNDGRPWAKASFQVMQSGQPTQEWMPTAVHIADATGNSYDCRTATGSLPNGIAFSALCPYEPAWKMRVTFSHLSPSTHNLPRGKATTRENRIRMVEFLVQPPRPEPGSPERDAGNILPAAN